MRHLRGIYILVAAASWTSPAHAEWVELKVPNFGYSAVFPVTPEQNSSEEQGVKLSGYSAGSDSVLCLVQVGDYPYAVTPDVELTASRDNFVKGVEGTLSSAKRGTFPRGAKQLPSVEFDAASAAYRFRSIIVTDGSRVYQVVGGVPKEAKDDADLEHCVRGFKLLP